MRRLTLSLILLALIPAGGSAQASYSDELPAPPHLDLCAPCFDSTLEYFLSPQEVPPFPPEFEAPSESHTPRADPWENLGDLRKGQNVRILHTNSQQLDARFVGISEAALVVQVSKKTLRLAREDVVMVSLKPPSKAKRILLGMLAGGAAGFSAWAEADRHARNCWDDDGYYCERRDGLSSRSAVIATAAGAGIAGLISSFVKADELVIYFNQWRSAAPQAPHTQASPPK